MSDLSRNIRYDNPGLDADLLAAIEALVTKHRLDDGRSGRALTAAVVVRWEYPDDEEPERFFIGTGDNPTNANMLSSGALMFSRE